MKRKLLFNVSTKLFNIIQYVCSFFKDLVMRYLRTAKRERKEGMSQEVCCDAELTISI